ncbi:retrotransposon protein, putative, ty1-copia subclass [Tanacetum coccineum]
MDGKVHTYKARLVAKGYTQTQEIDYEETSSPVAKIKSIRIMLAIAAFYDYEIWHMDVKTAFLNEKLTEDVFMAQPEVVKNILKYLRNTKYRFLVYGGEEELGVTSYCDVSWKTNKADSHSQSGWVFLLNGGAVTWKISKQDTVADSTCESEYIAACEASKEAIWVKNFIKDLGVVPTVQDPIEIFCDNESAFALTK